MTTRIPVASAQPYEVVVGHGAVTEVRGLVAGAARVAVVHPPVLAGRARALRDFVARDGLAVHLVEVPDGEAAKTSDVAAFCWGVLAEAGFTIDGWSGDWDSTPVTATSPEVIVLARA